MLVSGGVGSPPSFTGSPTLSGNLTVQGGTITCGTAGVACTYDALATGTTGLLIRSNTANSGAADTGIILRTVGDLNATADFALRVQDNNGAADLLTLTGGGVLTLTGDSTANDTGIASLVNGRGSAALVRSITVGGGANADDSGPYISWQTGAAAEQLRTGVIRRAGPPIAWGFEVLTTGNVPVFRADTNSLFSFGTASAAATLEGLATGTTGFTIKSDTAATGGTDVGVTIQTGADLGSADSVLVVKDNAGASTLFQVLGNGNAVVNNSFNVGTSASIFWNARSVLKSSADGVIELSNNASSDFTRLNFGGTTSSFPALARSGTTLQVKLADGSADTTLQAGNTLFTGATHQLGAAGTAATLEGLATGATGLTILSDTTASGGADIGIILKAAGDLASSDAVLRVDDGGATNLFNVDGGGNINVAGSISTVNGSLTVGSGALMVFSTRSKIASSADGLIELKNNAGTDFTRLNFGGTTAAFPGLQRSGTTLQVKLADSSAFTTLEMGIPKFSGTNTTGAGSALPELTARP
ncbi:MAG: hypothetical protein U0514_03635 [Candidatus Andersenbacteria bacterium]